MSCLGDHHSPDSKQQRLCILFEIKANISRSMYKKLIQLFVYKYSWYWSHLKQCNPQSCSSNDQQFIFKEIYCSIIAALQKKKIKICKLKTIHPQT